MNETKAMNADKRWTPGPWEFWGANVMVGRRTLFTSPAADHHDECETCANAHLAAAAPELYDALEELHAEVERIALLKNIGHEGSNLLEVIVSARVALAKARGESK
jgi:hypothetical protein